MSMSMSMSFNYNTNVVLKPEFSSQNLVLKPFTKTSIILRHQSSCLKQSHYSKQVRVKFASSSSAVIDPKLDRQPSADDLAMKFLLKRRSESTNVIWKLGVVVKPNGKSRLVLKFIWMQNDIGIALDQMIPGHGTIPLSHYYFWPRKDAWEELRLLLESKPWISQMERIQLLNQATDIINLWQTSGGNL